MRVTAERRGGPWSGLATLVPWVLFQTLAQRRRRLVYWMAGLGGFAFYLGAFFPSIQGNQALDDMLKDLPPYLEPLVGQVSNFTTAAGFLDAKLFLLTGPVILAAFTIAFGISIVAGEEQAGTLDLVLSYPLTRGRLVVEKYVAMGAATALLAASQAVGLWGAAAAYNYELDAGGLAAVSLHLWLLAMALGSVALLIANASGRRGVAAGATALFALISYLINSLAGLSTTADTLRPLSVFYYYHGHAPILEGVNWNDVAVLGLFCLACLAASLVAVNRRDLGT